MEPSLLTSIFGIIIFAIIMFLGFKYANGKWKVSESRKTEYLNWTNKHGKKVKIGIVIISIIFIDESKERDLDDHFFGIFGGNSSGILSKSVINEMIKMATLYLDDSQYCVLRCRRHFYRHFNIS